MTDSLTKSPRERRDVLRDDGTLSSRGFVADGQQIGYWEWFRRDGSLLRSGYFDAGQPISVWSDYDEAGRVTRSLPADRYPNLDLVRSGLGAVTG